MKAIMSYRHDELHRAINHRQLWRDNGLSVAAFNRWLISINYLKSGIDFNL